MIAVIADDLTGAAELSGIGARHGLKTELRLDVPVAAAIDGLAEIGADASPDLLVIAGDSRSKGQTAAVEEMLTLTRQLRSLRPEWIYKKTDSVLRGHVLTELKAHLSVLGLEGALLVPANPALGRTIRGGRYYLHDKPIHESAFSIDPEFPIRSSDVQEMLRTRQQPVQIRRPEEELPVRGIIVGEVRDEADLRSWARRLPYRMLAAGAAGFFRALLEARVPRVATADAAGAANEVRGLGDTPSEGVGWGSPLLFVSGSTFDSSRELIRERLSRGGPVRYLSEVPGSSWSEEVAGMLAESGKAIVAIDPDWHHRTAAELRGMMAIAVGELLRGEGQGKGGLLKGVRPAEIIIEGGATAYAIIKETGWRAFIPEQELAPGVIRMRVPDAPGLFVTVKPGSYRWPEIPV